MISPPLTYVFRQKRRLAQVAVWSVGVTLAPLVSGRFVANAIDAASGELWLSFAWIGALAAAAAIGVCALLNISRLAADMTADIQTSLTTDVVRQALADAVRSNNVRRSGAELTEHVPVLVDTLGMALRTAPNGLFAIGAVTGLASISPVLAGLVVPWLAIAPFLLATLVRHDTRNQATVVRAGDALYGETMLAIKGVRDLVAAGAKDYAMRRQRSLIRKLKTATLRQVDVHALRSGAVFAATTWLPTLTALAFVPSLVRNGSLTPGEVVGSFTYMLAGLSTTSVFVTSMARYLVTVRVRHKCLVESVSATGHVQPTPAVRCEDLGGKPEPLRAVPRPEMVVRDLTFAYGQAAHPIVEGLDLRIPFGDHIAIVGPSGVGKSTLAALLAGALAPDKGTITVSGTSLTQSVEMFQLVSFVPQETYIFAGSLRDNLRYLRPSATDKEIAASAAAIGLRRVMDRLGGLDAQVDVVKSGLSAGERQLLTLARVHLKATPIVVLDEATCHLDPAAEDQVERTFMATDATLIVVAHRMSATRRAKRVIVMNAGKIDIGRHDELLNRNAMYADLHALWSPKNEATLVGSA